MFLTMFSVARHGRDRSEKAAHIAEASAPDREEMSVLVQRQFDIDFVVAAMCVGHERAGAVVGPFHGPAELPRRVQDADIFGIDLRLHAEGAADIAGQHAHLVRLRTQDIGELALHAEHALALQNAGSSVRLTASYSPIAARGSIGATTRRVLRKDSFVTCARLREGLRRLCRYRRSDNRARHCRGTSSNN